MNTESLKQKLQEAANYHEGLKDKGSERPYNEGSEDAYRVVLDWLEEQPAQPSQVSQEEWWTKDPFVTEDKILDLLYRYKDSDDESSWLPGDKFYDTAKLIYKEMIEPMRAQQPSQPLLADNWKEKIDKGEADFYLGKVNKNSFWRAGAEWAIENLLPQQLSAEQEAEWEKIAFYINQRESFGDCVNWLTENYTLLKKGATSDGSKE